MIDRLLDTAARRASRRGPDLGGDRPEDARVDRLRRLGTRVVVLAVLLQSAVHLGNVVLFGSSVDVLNVDVDGGVFSWASVVITFAVASQLLVLAVLAAGWSRLLMALAVSVAYLSLDDAVQLHERVSELKTELGPVAHFSRTFWPLVYLPLLAFVFLGLLALATRMRREDGRLVVVALVGLGVAVLLEMTSPALFALGFDHGQLGYEWEAVVEEGLELGAWSLAALALTCASTALPLDPAAPAGRQRSTDGGGDGAGTS